MLVSVVIPAYNERKTVVEVVKKVKAVRLGGLKREIIVVDDGSTDGTREVLRKLRGVKVVYHDRNLGKGAALRSGFAHVKGDYIIVQDADLEYDPSEYPKLLETLLDGSADVVYGSRFLGGPHRVLLFWNYVGNVFLNFVSNMLADVNLTDMETGHKAFRRKVLKEVRLKSNGFEVEPEFTMKVARKGYRIYEVPISYRGRTRAEGKKITLKDGVLALFTLFRYRLFD